MSETRSGLRQVFEHSVGLDSTAERLDYLEEACAGDFELRREVESLLRAHVSAGDFLELPAVVAGPTPAAPGPGSRIGPYRLVREIGSGAMGVVYAAEQEEPIRRQVAIKVIRAGRDSRQVVARFEAERQAMALMDHPNIARALDAGETDLGQPYFVMELVEGRPITQYCNRAMLTPRERLELLVPVCEAIQHAHQKGVIHRDVKPSNVLVALYDGRPVPKVIDFGIAKAIGRPLTDRTPETIDGTIVGTLEYMSPEQAETGGLDVDTRSDVYSLGVLCYELLTGTTPLDLPGNPANGCLTILGRIREATFPPPSRRVAALGGRLAAIAAGRATDPARLARMLRGDLDRVAMKALQKDRGQRYATAKDYSDDVRRYLASLPVEAMPPSAAYRLRKFARRHRVGVATTAAVVAVLATAAAVSIGQAVVAAHARAHAAQSEGESRSVLAFLRHRVLAAPRAAGRRGGLGGGVTLREALASAESELAADFAGQPALEAAIRDTLGSTYLDLGEIASAVRNQERSLALRRQTLGPADPATLTAMNNLALAYLAAGKDREAAALHEEALRGILRTRGPDHPDTLVSMNNLAAAYRRAGRAAEAVPLLERVVARRASALGPDHPSTLVARNNLAVAYQACGRAAEAVPIHRGELERCRRTLGAGHPDTLVSMNNLAAAYEADGRTELAIPLLVEVVKSRETQLAPDHPDTLTARNNLAAAYRRAGRVAEAAPLFEKVVAGREAKLGPDHPETLAALSNLGTAYLDLDRFEQARAALADCLERRERVSPDDWRRFVTMSQLGAALAGLGRAGEAEPYLRRGYEGLSVREAQIPVPRKSEVGAAAARLARLKEGRRTTGPGMTGPPP